MAGSDEHFLARWSRRKLERTRGEPERPASAAEPQPAAGAEPPEQALKVPKVLTEADFADVDFDALDAGSDYARFMAPGVPASIRAKALRRLWAADPVLSAPDGLFDYADDYTDAARAVAPGTLQTAYRIGRGFLSDEEAAEWERLGRPPEATAAASAEKQPAEPQPEPAAVASRDQEPAPGGDAPSPSGEEQPGRS